MKTVKPPREGRGGRDGTFEISFFPGVMLEPIAAKGTPIAIQRIQLDDLEEPEFFVGYRADGVQIRVPIKDVKKKQSKALIQDLKAQAKAGG